MLTGREKVSQRCMKIYDGDSVVPKNICVKGNIWTKMSVVKKRRNLFNLTFDGELVLDVDNIQRVSSLPPLRALLSLRNIGLSSDYLRFFY